MSDTTANLDPAILDGNLAALGRTDPAVAAVLDAARPHMPAVAVCATRDGRLNFRLPDAADGRAPWFGRTSIPLTRATALIEQFQSGNANVMLPGMGEGTEVDLLLSRLSVHRAVFIWEPDPVNVLLAMRLHDWARAIEDDRLVFVLPEQGEPVRAGLHEPGAGADGAFALLTEALLAALGRRPGHFCPDRILMWPWYSMASIAPCRSAVEAAYHEIERRRRDRLVELQRQLSSLPAASGTTDDPPAVLLSIHTQEETQALADALISAAGQTGWDLAAAVIRKPGDVHPLSSASRLTTGLKSRPMAAVLLDVCRNELADVLPPTVPAIVWLTHRSSPDGILDRIGKADRIMATNAKLADSLTAAGVEATRITIAPLPCLRSDDDPPADWDDRPLDLAICANLASTDPTVHGHELPTHTKVWQTVLERIRSRIDKFTDGDVPGMLTAAESALRMRIDHPGARQSIIRLLGGPAASALIWQDLLQHLARAKIKADCWGLGWSADAGLQLRGPIPGLADRAAVYRQAKCVLFASPTGVVPADVLLAAAAGAVVIWRKHPLDTCPGGLANLLKPGEQAVIYAANRDLPRLVSGLLADSATWKRIAATARQRCRTDHPPTRAIALLKAAATSFRCVGPD